MAKQTGGAAGRPRDPGVDERILTSTQDLLEESGFDGTTVDAVAERAGCSKAAIYRRWPDKVALAVAAVGALYDPPPVPDTGSLREDLLACAHHYVQGDERAARVLARLLGSLGDHEQLFAAAYTAIGQPPAANIDTVIGRWIDAGVVPAGVPRPLLVRIIPSVAFGEMVTRRRALDAATAADLVDRVLLPALARG